MKFPRGSARKKGVVDKFNVPESAANPPYGIICKRHRGSFSAAARALGQMADHIERHPDALSYRKGRAR
jgi:hypothetical protein